MNGERGMLGVGTDHGITKISGTDCLLYNVDHIDHASVIDLHIDSILNYHMISFLNLI